MAEGGPPPPPRLTAPTHRRRGAHTDRPLVAREPFASVRTRPLEPLSAQTCPAQPARDASSLPSASTSSALIGKDAKHPALDEPAGTKESGRTQGIVRRRRSSDENGNEDGKRPCLVDSPLSPQPSPSPATSGWEVLPQRMPFGRRAGSLPDLTEASYRGQDHTYSRQPPSQSPSPSSPPSSSPRRLTATHGLDSTSYAVLASDSNDLVACQSTQPSISYAAVAAAPPPPRPATTSADPAPVAAAPRSSGGRSYPPIVVERLPEWTRHFAELQKKLGHAPNARPFGKGVRFLARTPEEFRVVQHYLTEVAASEPAISWFCYAPETDLPTKVALRGLTVDTSPSEIQAALEQRGFPVRHVRNIPPRRGRPGCLFFIQLDHLNQEELRRLYATEELLFMPGVGIEAWRGRAGPPQCHRCQAFGHASANCHRPIKCVRCAGEHAAADCPRPRDDPPTCANCAKAHTANNRRCKVFLREARRRGSKIPPPPPLKTPSQKQPRPPTVLTAPPDPSTTDIARAKQTTSVAAPTTLAPPANAPTDRGAPLTKKRRKRGKKKKKATPDQLPAASTPIPEVPNHHASQPKPLATHSAPVVVAASVPVMDFTAQAEQKKKLPLQLAHGQPASTETGVSRQDPIAIMIGILSEVLQAITFGEDPLPIVMRGLTILSGLRHGS